MQITLEMGPGYAQTIAELGAMGRSIAEAVDAGLGVAVQIGASHVGENYLSGQALKRRTGNLADAVQGWVTGPGEGEIGVRPGSAVDAYKWLLTDEEKITIVREIPLTQETDLQNQGAFNAESLETAFDKITMITQQLNEKMDRAVLQDVTSITPITLSTLLTGIDPSQVSIAAAAAIAAINAALAAALASFPIVRGTFVNADLVAGKLTIIHNKGLTAPYTLFVQIYNNTGKTVLPDYITGAINSHEIDLASYGAIAGNWGYIYL